MKCYDWEILSRYQDGSLDEAESRRVCEHLMGCLSCQEKLRSLGRAGLFLRIGLASRRHSDCPGEEELGAYLSGRLPLKERRRIEGHLVQCVRCLHEVAALSDPTMMQRSSGSPVPDKAALARFRRLAPAAVRVKRPVVRLAFGWSLAAAAAIVIAVVVGQFAGVGPTSPTTTAGLIPTAASDESDTEFFRTVRLESRDAVLRPDGAELAEFASDVGVILREIELLVQQPRAQRFKLVKDEILTSGIIETVARLKEQADDSADRNFLGDCEYLLMQFVKVEPQDLKVNLGSLISEIRRLNLIETARLMEIERGWSPCLASRS